MNENDVPMDASGFIGFKIVPECDLCVERHCNGCKKGSNFYTRLNSFQDVNGNYVFSPYIPVVQISSGDSS